MIQSYNPENFTIQCAKEQNYEKFYETEIALRKQLKYPPFCDIIVIGISSKDKNEVKQVSEILEQLLRKQMNENGFISKPIPAPISKIKNRYRWRIIIKCNFNNAIINKMNQVLEDYYQMKFKNARVIIDVNPSSMM